MLKVTEQLITSPLTVMFNKILQGDKIPIEWTSSDIILMHKKGEKCNLNNYRPISLLSGVGKTFSKLLQLRIKQAISDFQPPEQAGFRAGFSTIDHLHVINQLIEKSNEYRFDIYLGFIDYEKAFDSLEHEYMYTSLSKTNIERDIVNVIKRTYDESTARIVLERTGPLFKLEKGVKQGEPLSSDLFITASEAAFRTIDWADAGVEINGERLTHLRFADDVVVICKSSEELSVVLEKINEAGKLAGFRMNAAKTKIMTDGQTKDLFLEDKKIEWVTDTIYLGQLVSLRKTTKKEIDRRISLAWKKYWSLKFIFKSGMDIKLKRKAFDACILPCLIYASQTWAMTNTDAEKIRIAQRAMERSILGVKKQDRWRNEKIRRISGLMDAVEEAMKLKWKWAGHLARLKDGRWTKKVTEWWPMDKTRGRGRPARRWRDDLEREAGVTWMRKAQNKELWKTTMEAYVQIWTSN